MKQKSASVILYSNSGVAGHSGVDGQLGVATEEGAWCGGSGRILNFCSPGRFFEAFTKGVPSGFRLRVLPGLPCFLDTPYTHCEPLAVQRAHIGCSLLHFTLDAAHASQLARSFRRSGTAFDGRGADVGEGLFVKLAEVGVEQGGSGACHSWAKGVKDIVSGLNRRIERPHEAAEVHRL
jgi:hypothetical protein